MNVYSWEGHPLSLRFDYAHASNFSILLIFFILGGLCGTTKFFNLLTLNMFDPQIYFWQGVILTLTHFNRENTDVYRTDIKF